MDSKNYHIKDELRPISKAKKSNSNSSQLSPDRHRFLPTSATDLVAKSEFSSNTNLKVLLACATCCGILNAYHVSTLFENDRHFSHLSNLEREMTFRTEMGFYYFYYKTIVQSESFIAGLNKLMYDNKTEYPDTINTLQRFNLLPEVMLGGSYRLFTQILKKINVPLPQICWQVSRGDSQPPVLSCEGIGDPVYWYLSGVWICAGFTAALIFLSGSQLSNSLAGGFLAIICFFFNHGEATRVQWTPPLRESFAFHFSLSLNMLITYSLRRPRVSWVQPLLFGNLALFYLLCWQFAQFTLVFSVGILYCLYTLGLCHALPMLLALLGSLYALINAIILQFANPMLLASPLAGVLLGIILLYVFMEPLLQTLPPPSNIGAQLAFLFISSIASKMELSRVLSIEDDDHIINLLKSKFTSYFDFHTKLYTCSKEFDFLPHETVNKLSETLLLPAALISVGAILLHMLAVLKTNLIKRIEEREKPKSPMTPVWDGVDCGIVYNVVLLLVYGVMASIIMRLKLFLTPQLCIIASLLASKDLWKIITRIEMRYALLGIIVSAMCVGGIRNLAVQRSIAGEYSEPHLEELLQWIETEVGQEAAFAGPMPTMANILLSTGRPVVNHPHYENAALRQRTKAVYSIFSRKRAEEVYETLLSMKVSYIVLEESWCLRRSKPGCGMVDLWDKEDPKNSHRSPLCPNLFHHNSSPFHKVFSNDVYVVLQVPSKYVEILAPRTLVS